MFLREILITVPQVHERNNILGIKIKVVIYVL